MTTKGAVFCRVPEFTLWHDGRRIASSGAASVMLFLMEVGGYEGGQIRLKGKVVYDDATENSANEYRVTPERNRLLVQRGIEVIQRR